MPYTQQSLLNLITKHKSEFLSRVKGVHGDKYQYNVTKYLSPHVKMEMTCPKHGTFLQKPYDHLSGKGCKRCAVEAHANKIRFDTATFIAKSNLVHNNKYDYRKTNYIDVVSTVVITCPVHGDFEQNAGGHMQGSGCFLCGRRLWALSVTNTTENFIIRAKEKHGDRYDYTKSVYEHCDRPVIIVCKTHGDFLQAPSSHMSGMGCKKCSNDAAREAYTLTTEAFLEKAKLKHGDRYSYDKVKYVSYNTPVIITCSVHGDFEQTPGVHIRGSGCRKCDGAARSFTTVEFVERAKIMHGDRYDYSNTDYNGCFNEVAIGCRSHGEFYQQANSHVRGTGCPQCAESRGERDVAFVLDKLKLAYLKQHMLPKNLYKYDFYLPDHNVFIEYHGIQHYQKVGYFHREEGSFQNQMLRDHIKAELVKAYKGTLIVIRYTFKTREQIEQFLTRRLVELRILY